MCHQVRAAQVISSTSPRPLLQKVRLEFLVNVISLLPRRLRGLRLGDRCRRGEEVGPPGLHGGCRQCSLGGVRSRTRGRHRWRVRTRLAPRGHGGPRRPSLRTHARAAGQAGGSSLARWRREYHPSPDWRGLRGRHSSRLCTLRSRAGARRRDSRSRDEQGRDRPTGVGVSSDDTHRFPGRHVHGGSRGGCHPLERTG